MRKKIFVSISVMIMAIVVMAVCIGCGAQKAVSTPSGPAAAAIVDPAQTTSFNTDTTVAEPADEEVKDDAKDEEKETEVEFISDVIMYAYKSDFGKEKLLMWTFESIETVKFIYAEKFIDDNSFERNVKSSILDRKIFAESYEEFTIDFKQMWCADYHIDMKYNQMLNYVNNWLQ